MNEEVGGQVAYLGTTHDLDAFPDPDDEDELFPPALFVVGVLDSVSASTHASTRIIVP
jgi:hypothetical protein